MIASARMMETRPDIYRRRRTTIRPAGDLAVSCWADPAEPTPVPGRIRTLSSAGLSLGLPYLPMPVPSLAGDVMTDTSSPLSALSESDRQFVRDRVAEFERTWTEGRLGPFMQEQSVVDPLRHVLLVELVKLDLKNQWQRNLHVPVE